VTLLGSSFRYRELAPAPALARSVACYWTIDATETPGHRVLPDGCMDILFDLAQPSVAAEVIGVMTAAVVTPASAQARMFGVRFLPGEAFAFLDVPAKEGRDRVLSLEDAWGASARSLHARVLAAPDDAARVALLNDELAQRRRRAPDPRLRAVVSAIRAARGAVRVEVLAERTGLGERQLERLFDERVGVGPKSLAKVARMQALLGALATGARGWSGLAAELGWADQSHLVRDLRGLAGLTPTELARAMEMSDSSNPPYGPLART
jgi:AraC-like DNA-binding protein